MKKRSQKLTLNRETLIRLEALPEAKQIERAAGGYQSSCIGNCACLEEVFSVGGC